MQQKQRRVMMYTGSWGNREQKGCGSGISAVAFDTENGSFRLESVCSEVEDPGTLVISQDGRYLYCANEMTTFPDGEYATGGGITAMKIHRDTGELELLNKTLSLGALPCYITMNPEGTHVCCSNHGSFAVVSEYIRGEDGTFICCKTYDRSSVALFEIEGDGRLKEGCDLMPLYETGSYHIYKEHRELLERRGPGQVIEPEVIFQTRPHAHSVNFHKEGCGVICDRGADMLYLVRINREKKRLEKKFSYKTRLGTAPRHLAFHPKLECFYVANELESSVSVYQFQNRFTSFEEIQTVWTLPENSTKKNAPSDIHVHPEGNFVYASNHGDNSIAVYRVDQRDGRLELCQIQKMEGEYPRGFDIDPSGKYLVVGNMDSDTVTSYRIDEATGNLSFTGHSIEINTPTCIRFVVLS